MIHLRSSTLNNHGSALIAVFWMIAILGMVMFAGAKALQADTEFTRMMRGRIFAKRYAEMGLEVARHPAIQQDDPLLHFTSNDGGGYNVTLVSEEARLNVNHLVQTGDKVLLRRLFTRWGFKPEFVAALCDGLKDWVDADENVSLNGAEKRDYAKMGFEGMPFNRPFKEVEEMLHVRGMEIVNTERPDWREWFTVFGDGRVDINDARPELISLLADVPMERVFVNLDRYGNTSAGTIPIALAEAADQGRIQPGDYVLLTAFGGGLTWASSVIRWGRP